MKKILFLHSGAELYGADVVMLELIKGLNKKKFDIYVLLPNDGPLVEKLKQEKVQVSVLNYPILRRKYFNLSGIIQYIFNYYRYSKEIVKYCVDNKIDIIHVNTSAVLEGCYVKKKLKLPVVWHIHEILTSPRAVVNFMFKRIAKYADKIVCVSNAVKENFERIVGSCGDRIEVIYNGVDSRKFKPDNGTDYLKKELHIEDNDTTVGMIGRVNSWKGQEDLIKAMNLVMNRCKSNIKVILVGGVFAGQEWRMDKLKRIVLNSKFKNNFIVSDFRKDTPNLYSLFDIFVLPSIKPDPLPTVVLEAMASGVPIVGYKHGGICEMVIDGRNGLLAEVGNVEDLAEKIKVLVENKKMRKEIGVANIKRQRANFSVSNYIVSFERLYGAIR